MKINNVKEVEEFIKVVNGCKDKVILVTPEQDVLNLKSALSQYVAIGELIKSDDMKDNIEIFAVNKEDEQLLLNYLTKLDQAE